MENSQLYSVFLGQVFLVFSVFPSALPTHCSAFFPKGRMLNMEYEFTWQNNDVTL